MKESGFNRLFVKIRAEAAVKYPVLKKVKWAYCMLADEMHRKKWRWFAHTFHVEADSGMPYICVSRAILSLSDRNIIGILWHEFGHLIAGQTKSEAAANQAIDSVFGHKIRYDSNKLQYLLKKTGMKG